MNKSRVSGASGIEFAVKSLVCAVMGLLLTMILLLGFSVMMTRGAGSQNMVSEYVIVSVIIGSAFAGLRSAKKRNTGVITAGFLASVCYILLLLIGAVFAPNSSSGEGILLKNVVAALCGGCFGGTLALYRKNKKSKLRR